MTIHNKLFNSKATMSNLINKIMYSWPFMLPKEKIPIFYSNIGMEIKKKRKKKKKASIILLFIKKASIICWT